MLRQQNLVSALRPLYTPGTMPKTDPVGAWLRAYVTYAKDVMAGPTGLVSPLVPQQAPGDFLTALDGALRATWMRATWAGLGATGVTTLVPAVQPFMLPNFGWLNTEQDRERALNAIAQSIHTYTLSITVTVTTASGVSSVVTLA